MVSTVLGLALTRPGGGGGRQWRHRRRGDRARRRGARGAHREQPAARADRRARAGTARRRQRRPSCSVPSSRSRTTSSGATATRCCSRVRCCTCSRRASRATRCSAAAAGAGAAGLRRAGLGGAHRAQPRAEHRRRQCSAASTGLWIGDNKLGASGAAAGHRRHRPAAGARQGRRRPVPDPGQPDRRLRRRGHRGALAGARAHRQAQHHRSLRQRHRDAATTPKPRRCAIENNQLRDIGPAGNPNVARHGGRHRAVARWKAPPSPATRCAGSARPPATRPCAPAWSALATHAPARAWQRDRGTRPAADFGGRRDRRLCRRTLPAARRSAATRSSAMRCRRRSAGPLELGGAGDAACRPLCGRHARHVPAATLRPLLRRCRSRTTRRWC